MVAFVVRRGVPLAANPDTVKVAEAIQRSLAAEQAAGTAAGTAASASATAANAKSLAEAAAGAANLANGAAEAAQATADLAMPSVLHDYTHGIPLDRLAPVGQPFDKGGVADSRAKLAAAMVSAAGDDLPILIPAKSALRIVSTEPLVPHASGTKLRGARGAGGRPVILHDEASYDDRVNNINVPNGYTDLFRLDGSPGVLDLEDVILQGSAQQRRSEGVLRLINGLTSHGGIRLRGVDLTDTRAVALWSVGCAVFDTHDTMTARTIRGGWHIRDPRGPVRITRYGAAWNRDDTLHINMAGTGLSGLTYPPGGQDVFIDDVRLLGCNGILFSGVKRGYIGRVRGKLCTNRLIKIGADHTFGAGDTSSLDIIVRDVIGEDLLAPQDAGIRHNWIELFWLVPDADGLPAYPGQAAPDGSVVQPYGSYYAADMTHTAGVPSIPGRGIVIDGFIGRRTLSPTTAFSTYGHGLFWNRDGDTDLPVTASDLSPDGILAGGGISDLTVRNVDFEGVHNGLLWDLTGVPEGTIERVVFDNFKVRDAAAAPVTFVGGNGGAQDITFRRTDIDGDPYCKHTARAPGGTWQDINSYTAFDVAGVTRIRLEGVRVRNVARIISNPSTVIGADNIAFCDPVAMGYDAANRGIGRLIEAERGWRYEIEGSNPTDATTWRKTLNPCPQAATAVPNSGKWVAGAWVRNTAPANDGIVGWRRLTTGSTNADGVDWMTVRAAAAAGYQAINVNGSATITLSPAGTVAIDVSALTGLRNRVLPQPVASAGIVHLRHNGTGNSLAVKSLSSAGATIATLSPGDAGVFAWSGSGWVLVELVQPVPAVTPVATYIEVNQDSSRTFNNLSGVVTIVEKSALTAALRRNLAPAPAGTRVRIKHVGSGGNLDVRDSFGTSFVIASVTPGSTLDVVSTGTAWLVL